MELKHVMRAVLLVTMAALAVIATTTQAWWAVLACANEFCGMGYAMWEQADPGPDESANKWLAKHRWLPFKLLAAATAATGLVLALSRGLGWWSLAIASGSFAVFLLSIVVTVVAELDELDPDDEPQEAHG